MNQPRGPQSSMTSPTPFARAEPPEVRTGNSPAAPTTLVTNLSPPEAKIALFRALFRGRDDLYARRFENRRTGRAGYAPACGNEWIPGVCAKPRIKCADCPNRRFLPVTDDVIRWHLSGKNTVGGAFVMGIYPMLLDETDLFLAVDFDGALAGGRAGVR